jgi:4-amino-4-deoxy-L-arabinose transferase-like glycosyltransferase
MRLAGVAKPPALFALGLLCCTGFWWTGLPRLRLTRVPLWLTLIGSAFFVFYLVHALAPEIESDANTYHLLPAVDALRTGQFSDQISFYERLPQGIENLFVMAYAIGGSSAAKLVHFAYLVATLPLIVLIGRRFGLSQTPGRIAALLYFLLPVAAVSGTSAFNDAALVFYLLATVEFLARWIEEKSAAFLFYAGLSAGFCYAVKITGLVYTSAALLVVAVLLFRAPVHRLRSMLIFIAAVGFAVFPWMLRNAIETGNPFAPLLNRLFPNPYFYVTTEDVYAQYLKSYAVSWRQLSYALAISGDKLQGLFGPILFLAPIAVLGARKRSGQFLLLLWIIASLPWLFNHGARFLVPGAPFLLLALVSAVPMHLAIALLVFQAITCSPWALDWYTPNSWRLKGFPLTAALRIEPAAEYMVRASWDYRVARFVEDHTKPDDRVLDLYGLQAALLSREITGTYQSATGTRLSHALHEAWLLDRNTLSNHRAEFPEQPVSAVKIRQTAATQTPWSIYEVEFFRGSLRIANSRDWILEAWPNPWEAPLALDNNLISRWTTGEPAKPGMFLQVDFRFPVVLSAFNVTGNYAERYTESTLYFQRPSGEWVSVTAPRNPKPGMNLRRSATRLIRREGIRYIVAHMGDDSYGPVGKSLAEAPTDWGVGIVGHIENIFLFRIF